MQIQSKNHTAIASSQSNSVETFQPKINISQQAKKMQDVAILEASKNNNVANSPMELLYKTAIEEINKQLEPTLGKNAVQSSYESGLDVTPEATAQRIVQGSTAFYQAFKEQNSELGEEESLNEFLSVISSGIDKGFEEAKDILDSLSVLEGDIETNIDLTYDYVQQGLSNFKEQLLASFAEKEETDVDTIKE